ncbi:MAG TPA: diadenylate cyclase CdaA [Melioribacteraceae bacterium]|nr:diadenylate cyclase CdaA [Melioribacteraceae bacterium]
MVEIIKIGFLSFTILDLLDIVLVTLIIYKLYNFIKGTIAQQIFFGLILVLLLSFIAQAANFKALGWLLKLITDIWVIAFIVLFQPEIRRVLVMLGRYPLLQRFAKQPDVEVANILTEASFEMAKNQHGALIVVVKSVGIRGVVETGTLLNAKLDKLLLRSIFYPRSPMHDGAVIVRDGIVEAAKCTLPLTNNTSIDGINLGMRHRAGVGISEIADVISIIVSEETGTISVAESGNLKRGLSKDTLRNYLINSLSLTKEKGWKSIFD